MSDSPFGNVETVRETFSGAGSNTGLLEVVSTPPVPYGKHGCRHVALRDGKTRAGAKICVDTVDIPMFGISDNGYSQMNAQLSIPAQTKTFLRDFTRCLIDAGYENRATWFPTVQTRSEIEKLFTPIFKEGRLKRDGDSWPALMRTSLGSNLFRSDFEELKGKTLACVTIDCSVLYINSNGRWGVKMVLESFIVKGAFGTDCEKALYTKFYRTPMNQKKRRKANALKEPHSPSKKARSDGEDSTDSSEEIALPRPVLTRSVNEAFPSEPVVPGALSL